MSQIEQLMAALIAGILLVLPVSFAIEFKSQADEAVAQANQYQERLDAAIAASTGDSLGDITQYCRVTEPLDP